MTDNAFLNTLRERPNDDTTRLVYADWLEDRGDEASRAKAEYIRLDCRLAAMPTRAKGRKALKKQRRELAEKIETAWLAIASKARIELCFRFQCPKQWDSLRPVEGTDTTRFCDECKREVYFCATLELARKHAEQDHCVAIDARHVRFSGDIEVHRRMGDWLPSGFE